MHPDELAYGRDLILRALCKHEAPDRLRSIPVSDNTMLVGTLPNGLYPWLTLRKD